MTATAPIHRLTLLGGAVVRANGAPLGGPAAHRHRLALLAILAATAAPVSRDRLIAFLWPERDAESGRNLLKVAVHELRKLLGEAALPSTGDQLSIDGDWLPCDLRELEAAAAARDHSRVVELYAGPFLDGFHLKDAPEFEHWVDGQRNRLEIMFGRSLEALASAAERSGDVRAASGWWRKLAALDPLRVDVALQLMRALDAAGEGPAAIRHAEIHAELRKRDFGLEPDPAVDGLAHELASRKSAKRPSPESLIRVAAVDHDENRELPSTRSPFSRRGRMGAFAAIILLASATALAVTMGRGGASGVGAPDVVAILPFRVVGSDTALRYLGDGMMEMLAARIGEDGPLRAMKTPSAPSATAGEQVPLALQQGRAAGAGKVLVGDVVAGGSRGEVDVSATIYSTADAAVIGRASRTIARGASIPATVDTLAAELIARAAGEPDDRLPHLAARPLPALRLYLAAQAAYRHGSYQRAESLFARSLDVDGTFALAGLGLALANSWTSISDHYGRGKDVALGGLQDLGARDRLFVNAFFAPDPQLGDPRPAPVYLQAWEDVVHKHPDFAEAWYHVGDRYYHFGGLSGLGDPIGQARTAFRRALEIDPGLVAPLHHLIEIYASRREVDEARATAERYFGNNPGVSRDASAIGWTVATVLNDQRWLARSRAAFAEMPLADLSRIAWITQANAWPTADADSALDAFERRASATFERNAVYSVRYAFALNAGRIADSRAAAADLEATVPGQPIAALWGAYAIMFGDADTTGLGDHLKALTTFAESPAAGSPDFRGRQVQARCLVAYAKLGAASPAAAGADLAVVRRQGAAMAAGSTERREAEMCVGWLGAAIAVEMNAPDASSRVARLDTMVLRDRVPPRMSLAAMAVVAARLHEQRGELKQALAASRWREHYTGDPMFLATQLRLEGDLARALGDRAAAVRAYRHYVALRTAPDSGVATERTEAVRRQLAALERP